MNKRNIALVAAGAVVLSMLMYGYVFHTQGIEVELTKGTAWWAYGNMTPSYKWKIAKEEGMTHTEYYSNNLDYIREASGEDVANECKQLAMNNTYSIIGFGGANANGNYILFSVKDLVTESNIDYTAYVDGEPHSGSARISYGNHTVKITADGYKDTEESLVYVSQGSVVIVAYMIPTNETPENNPPACSLSANPSSGVVPLTVTFSMSASDVDGNIDSWRLDVDGNGIPDFSGSGLPPYEKTYTYSSSGTYTAILTVVDDDGATTSDSVTINVYSGGEGGNGGGASSTPWGAIAGAFIALALVGVAAYKLRK